MAVTFLMLRSSPAPEGRCCFSARQVINIAQQFEVAILTGPGGPVLRAGAVLANGVDGVAILTGPGGPVLPNPTRRT